MSKNPSPPAPIELTPEQIALEEARKLVGQKLTPALVNAMYELLDDWTHQLAVLSHVPGLPLVTLEHDLNRVAGGCRCKAFFHNRRQYAPQLEQAGLL
jgi:hypothetical protein